MNSNNILAALGKVGVLFYRTMLQTLDSGNYPSGDSERGYTTIQQATSVDSPKKDGERYIVEIKIDLKKAPYAWAYEVGSGEHGSLGEKYPIVPKNKPYMVFPLSDWPNWEPWPPPKRGAVPDKNGLFFLVKVMHPGVEAKPYIRPTAVKINDEVKSILARDFKTEFLKGGKPVEVIK